MYLKSEKAIYACVSALWSQLFVTLWTVTHQGLLSMGFPMARTLEWVAISYAMESSWPRD